MDIRNGADQMVFQSEKTLGEIGDKVDASEKAELQSKIDALKEALKGSDIEAIKARQEELQKVFYSVSEKLYQQAAQAQQQNPGAGAGPDMGGYCSNGDPNVVDADYKEVDDDNK